MTSVLQVEPRASRLSDMQPLEVTRVCVRRNTVVRVQGEKSNKTQEGQPIQRSKSYCLVRVHTVHKDGKILATQTQKEREYVCVCVRERERARSY